MKRILPLAPLSLAAAVLVAGCGGGGSSSAASTGPATAPPATPAATTAAVRAPHGTLVKVRSTQYGRILVDRRGQALYQFTRDTRAGASRCTSDCARAWPPLYAGGAPVAGAGATQSKLGTTRRSGGRRQATYAGHPLYYYNADTPSQI